MADLTRKTANLWDEEYTNISSDIYYKPVYVGDYEVVTVSSTIPLTSQNFANLFALGGQQSSGASIGDNGVYSGRSMSVRPVDGYITIAYRNANGVNPQDYDTMVNEGRTSYTYVPYWQHSLRKLTTATGTGWHDASVKEKSENLAYDILVQDLQPVYSIVLLFSADLEPDTTYTLSFDSISGFYFYINEQVFNVKYINTVTGRNQVICTTKSALDKSDNRQYLNGRWIILKNAMNQPTNIDITNVMLNTGSTALPYEPYWK